jgi:hypothetical protein
MTQILHHYLMTLYLMTLSAFVNTFGGIVRPICLAAFRLMTSSNFVGCSTGRLAGLRALQNLIHVLCGAPKRLQVHRGFTRAAAQVTHPRQFLRLLRQRGNAKRKEHGAKRKTENALADY